MADGTTDPKVADPKVVDAPPVTPNPTEGDATPAIDTPAPAVGAFTQDQVDAILKERLARQKKSISAEYSDYASNKKKLEELEQASMTEAEKNAAELGASKEKLSELELALESAKQDGRNALIIAAIVGEAGKREFHNPGLVPNLLELGDFEVDDSGTVSGVGEALDSLVEREPYLIRMMAPKGAPNLNPGQGEPKNPASISLTSEQLNAAAGMGVSPEKYAERLGER